MHQTHTEIEIDRVGFPRGFSWFKNAARQVFFHRWKTFVLCFLWVIPTYAAMGLANQALPGLGILGALAYFTLWPLWGVSAAHAYERNPVGRKAAWADFLWGFTGASGVAKNWGLGAATVAIGVAIQAPAFVVLAWINSQPGAAAQDAQQLAAFEQAHRGLLMGSAGAIAALSVVAWLLLWLAPGLRARGLGVKRTLGLSIRAGVKNAAPALVFTALCVLSLMVFFAGMYLCYIVSIHVAAGARSVRNWETGLEAFALMLAQLALMASWMGMIGVAWAGSVHARREIFLGLEGNTESIDGAPAETRPAMGAVEAAPAEVRLSRGARRRALRRGEAKLARQRELQAREEAQPWLDEEPNPTIDPDAEDSAAHSEQKKKG